MFYKLPTSSLINLNWIMITIKNATLDDLELIAPLFDAYRVFYRKESDLEAARSFIKERISNGESIIYLALFSEEAVGFTQLYPIFSSTRLKRVWLLNDLYVDKNHRGKGISKLLLEKSKQLTIDTNAAAVILETEKSNIIGNQLYPSVGFTIEDDVNHYYWEP
jgi:GNAT superfamily N-acetyltransferase|tara:strand:+ start:372 stop:863 length:492 start_codon:yes stop_codon:yes gene_type:complete